MNPALRLLRVYQLEEHKKALDSWHAQEMGTLVDLILEKRHAIQQIKKLRLARKVVALELEILKGIK